MYHLFVPLSFCLKSYLQKINKFNIFQTNQVIIFQNVSMNCSFQTTYSPDSSGSESDSDSDSGEDDLADVLKRVQKEEMILEEVDEPENASLDEYFRPVEDMDISERRQSTSVSELEKSLLACSMDDHDDSKNDSGASQIVAEEMLDTGEQEKHVVDISTEQVRGQLVGSESEKESVKCVENSPQTIVPPKPLPSEFGFVKCEGLPTLTRHPEPYEGRDDDIAILQEILYDLMVKLGYLDKSNKKNYFDRILIGPDHKIGINVLKLIYTNPKFEVFVLEIPCLHFRKSLIGIIFSAHRHSGLIQLLRFMKDDEEKDWEQLVLPTHIEIATQVVKRLSIALHVSFMLSFMMSLPDDQLQDFQTDIASISCTKNAEKWDTLYQEFIDCRSKSSATFALHQEMAQHLDWVLAIRLAERLGGPDGHALLRATAKDYLPFGFVNGASSYAPYCVKLLHEHYRAGTFYINMKSYLFSTPLKDSHINSATDTKREKEHLQIVKSFRSGSTVTSAMRRIANADYLSEMADALKVQTEETEDEGKADGLGWNVSSKDLKHIVPTVAMILRQNGLSAQPAHVPFNVYCSQNIELTEMHLQKPCEKVGQFIIHKYLAKEGLFDTKATDIPTNLLNDAPSQLAAKVKRSKGTTCKKITSHMKITKKSERNEKEAHRKKTVAAHIKRLEGLSSEMNACQALFHPDCTKPKVAKAQGMRKALTELLTQLLGKGRLKEEAVRDLLREEKLVYLNHAMPVIVKQNVTIVTLEYAGVKFQNGKGVNSGLQYLKAAEGTLKKIMVELPNTRRMVVCEEKYHFTPDEFKAATREQRTSKSKSIAHLKTAENIISDKKFDKNAVIHTIEGKTLISSYLGKNVNKLCLKGDLIVDIDSEHLMEGCHCKDKAKCKCKGKYCVPVRARFSKSKGFLDEEKLTDIHQVKGEAEMSQMDWLPEILKDLQPGEGVANIVTSGDIDSVPIHLFYISKHWPRDACGNFLHPVYCLLKKGKVYDTYNITSIIRLLELSHSKYHNICQK